MPWLPGYQSDANRESFMASAAMHARGGPLAAHCGAKLRGGGFCRLVPLAGGPRCLRHAGPDAARAHRKRQLAGLRTGRVHPAEFERAEARRVRNALTDAWKKNPSLPGSTIDLGAAEGAFVAAGAVHGVDVTALYPAVADWLRWRWQRRQRDRRDDVAWQHAVRTELPRRIAFAEVAMRWVQLGAHDKRTLAGRALKAALLAGGMPVALALSERLQAAAEAAKGDNLRKGQVNAVGPLTPLPVQPWVPDSAPATAWRRRMVDRVKSGRGAAPKATRLPGRPRRVPDDPDDIAALGALLMSAGPDVQRMYRAIADAGEGLLFLRALRDYARDPDQPAALDRWLHWVTRLRQA